MTMACASCIVCGSTDTLELLGIDRIPVLCNELHDSRESARRAPTGRMDLCFCKNCGHYFNRSFDPALMYYSPNYDTSLYASAVFREYATALVDRLISTYDLRGKRIVEIGCGRGEFLRQICEAGENEGVGFDTSTLFEGQDPDAPRVTYVRDYFSQKYEDTRADLIVCQQVLEHIEQPTQFLTDLASTVTFTHGSPVFYCEVPNGLYTARDLGIWDLIYEHVSYFTPRSLSRAFIDAGFRILDSGEAYGGQYLFVEARVDPSNAGSWAGTDDDDLLVAERFAARFEYKVNEFRELLEQDEELTEATYVWGAGSKGITFCNLVDTNMALGGLIDRNAAKHGRYVGGTATMIAPPGERVPKGLKRVVVMNPRYADEIAEELTALGLSPTVVVA